MSGGRAGPPVRLVRALRDLPRRSPVLGVLVLLLFAAAVAQSMPIPVMALYAKGEFGASDLMVTVYFSVISLVSLVAAVVAGHRSDTARRRHPLIGWCFGLLVAGNLAASLAGSFTQLLVAGGAFFWAGTVLVSQLMALARETATAALSPGQVVAVTALARTAFSLGYITGAPVGSLLATGIDVRHVLWASAGVVAVCLAVSVLVLPRWAAVRGARTAVPSPPLPGERSPPGYRLVVMFSVAAVFLSCGRVIQLAMLPVVLHDDVRAPPYAAGVALAIPPLLELVLMPTAAAAAIRYGAGRVYLLGAGAIVAYYALLVTAGSLWQILLAQAVYAVYGAAGIMVGIDIAQGLLPTRVGTATSVYLGHEQAASVVGSLLAVGAVGGLGARQGFVAPLVMAAVGLVLVGCLFLRHGRAFGVTGPRRAAE